MSAENPSYQPEQKPENLSDYAKKEFEDFRVALEALNISEEEKQGHLANARSKISNEDNEDIVDTALGKILLDARKVAKKKSDEPNSGSKEEKNHGLAKKPEEADVIDSHGDAENFLNEHWKKSDSDGEQKDSDLSNEGEEQKDNRRGGKKDKKTVKRAGAKKSDLGKKATVPTPTDTEKEWLAEGVRDLQEKFNSELLVGPAKEEKKKKRKEGQPRVFGKKSGSDNVNQKDSKENQNTIFVLDSADGRKKLYDMVREKGPKGLSHEERFDFCNMLIAARDEVEFDIDNKEISEEGKNILEKELLEIGQLLGRFKKKAYIRTYKKKGGEKYGRPKEERETKGSQNKEQVEEPKTRTSWSDGRGDYYWDAHLQVVREWLEKSGFSKTYRGLKPDGELINRDKNNNTINRLKPELLERLQAEIKKRQQEIARRKTKESAEKKSMKIPADGKNKKAPAKRGIKESPVYNAGELQGTVLEEEMNELKARKRSQKEAEKQRKEKANKSTKSVSEGGQVIDFEDGEKVEDGKKLYFDDADSFEKLYQLIDERKQGLKGSGGSHWTPNGLKETIREIRDGKASINELPRTEGLRSKVKELLGKEKSSVGEKEKGIPVEVRESAEFNRLLEEAGNVEDAWTIWKQEHGPQKLEDDIRYSKLLEETGNVELAKEIFAKEHPEDFRFYEENKKKEKIRTDIKNLPDDTSALDHSEEETEEKADSGDDVSEEKEKIQSKKSITTPGQTNYYGGEESFWRKMYRWVNKPFGQGDRLIKLGLKEAEERYRQEQEGTYVKPKELRSPYAQDETFGQKIFRWINKPFGQGDRLLALNLDKNISEGKKAVNQEVKNLSEPESPAEPEVHPEEKTQEADQKIGILQRMKNGFRNTFKRSSKSAGLRLSVPSEELRPDDVKSKYLETPMSWSEEPPPIPYQEKPDELVLDVDSEAKEDVAPSLNETGEQIEEVKKKHQKKSSEEIYYENAAKQYLKENFDFDGEYSVDGAGNWLDENGQIIEGMRVLPQEHLEKIYDLARQIESERAEWMGSLDESKDSAGPILEDSVSDHRDLYGEEAASDEDHDDLSKTEVVERNRKVDISTADMEKIILEMIGDKASVDKLDISATSSGLRIDAKIRHSLGGGIALKGEIRASGKDLQIEDLKIDAGYFVRGRIKNNIGKLSEAVSQYMKEKYGGNVSKYEINNSGLEVTFE